MKKLDPPALQPLLLALIAATAATAAAAADKTWLCTDGQYTAAACWSPRGLPVYPDALQVGPVGGADTLLRYSFGQHNVARMVLDAPDFRPGQPGAVRMELSGGRFSVVGPLVVADRGWASLAMLPGANLSVQTLTLGQQAGANGNLQMNGGALGANSVAVGLAGAGQIDLAAGTLVTKTLQVWSGSGSSALSLSGGLLSASTSASVGAASGGYGLIDQSGGTLRTPVLNVGDGGAGAYVLRGSGQLVAAEQRLGVGGEGLLQQQDAGSRNTATQLLVGVTRQASYELLGGELVSDSTWVGQGAFGRFVTDGGTHRVGDLQIGTDPRGSGGYQLSRGLLAAVSVRVGAPGAVGVFVQNGGVHRVDDALEIGAGSRYLLQGSGELALGPNVTALNLGSFEHQNGARFAGTLDNAGSFVFGSSSGPGLPVFDGRLINRGTVALRVNGSFADGLRNEDVFNSLVTGRALALDGAGLDNAGTLVLGGGVLQGSGALRNGALVSGHGRIGGSAGFFNDGLVQQDGGTLVLANSQGATNRGRWVGQARQVLLLDGAGVVFDNQGQLALAEGLVSGRGLLHNGAAGVITGSGTVNSRLVNAGSLVLGAADRLTVTGAFSNTGLIDLGAAGASLAGQVLANGGLLAGRGRVANAVDNLAGGRIQADGGVLALGGRVANQGLLVAGPGGTLLLQGGLAQQGRLQLEGGTLDMAGNDLLNQGVIAGFGSLRGTELVNQRQILFSGGNSQVQANLDQQAGAQLIVSGGAVATFHGTVRARAGSELRVSDGSGAVFFGPVSQESGAVFTGGGTSWFEGGLSVGNSPGEGGVGGAAVFGDLNLYRAEIGGLLPGIGHDRFSAAGHLQLGGALQLSWWGGYAPEAGQRFDLFDWGSSSGRFSHIDFAAAPLAEGLRWDASRLYVDGSLAVAAVPEPGTWLLMAAGLAGLIWRRRRLRPALCLAASACGMLLGSAQAAVFDWSAASGVMPDQSGAFSRVARGAVHADLLAGGPLVLTSEGPGSQLLYYRASGTQIQMRNALVLDFTTRFVNSTVPVAGSLRSPLMVNVSFGNHVGASLMITERAASFNHGHDRNIAPGAQLDWYTMNQHRLVFSGSDVNGSVDHFINGIFRYRMPLQYGTSLFSAEPMIQFGDLTAEFSGSSEWLRFSHNAAAVPEPERAALMLTGLGLLGRLARRRPAQRARAAATACPSSITASA